MTFIKRFIKRIVSSPEKKVLVENFFSLSFLQTANYILPLIALPYLVRVLGPEKYGLIIFAQALIHYFLILTDYGFDFSATRQISIDREHKTKVSEIFSSVMLIKFGLMIISFLILTSIVIAVPKFRNDWLLYIFTFGMVFGNALFPIWLFQGMERMKYITFLHILAKLIFVIAIFIFIKETKDYIYVPLINSLGFLVSGMLGLLVAFKQFEVKFYLPDFVIIQHQLKEGWHIFVSMMAINMYTVTNIFVLGLFTNNTTVGYYAAAEKIVRAIIKLFNPIFQAIYPYITKVATKSKEKAVEKLRKLFKITFSVSFISFLVISIFIRQTVAIILGADFKECVIIVKILAPLLIIIPIAHIFANLALLPFKLDRYFSRIYITGSLINIILLFFTVYILKLSAPGAALSILITESALTLMMYWTLRKHNITIITIGK